MKTPKTLKKVSRSFSALVKRRSGVSSPSSSKSDRCDESSKKSQEVRDIVKVLSSQTMTETIGSDTEEPLDEGAYLQLLRSKSSTLSSELVGKLVEQELAADRNDPGNFETLKDGVTPEKSVDESTMTAGGHETLQEQTPAVREHGPAADMSVNSDTNKDTESTKSTDTLPPVKENRDDDDDDDGELPVQPFSTTVTTVLSDAGSLSSGALIMPPHAGKRILQEVLSDDDLTTQESDCAFVGDENFSKSSTSIGVTATTTARLTQSGSGSTATNTSASVVEKSELSGSQSSNYLVENTITPAKDEMQSEKPIDDTSAHGSGSSRRASKTIEPVLDSTGMSEPEVLVEITPPAPSRQLPARQDQPTEENSSVTSESTAKEEPVQPIERPTVEREPNQQLVIPEEQSSAADAVDIAQDNPKTGNINQHRASNDLMFCNYFHDIVDRLCNGTQIGQSQGQAKVESDLITKSPKNGLLNPIEGQLRTPQDAEEQNTSSSSKVIAMICCLEEAAAADHTESPFQFEKEDEATEACTDKDEEHRLLDGDSQHGRDSIHDKDTPTEIEIKSVPGGVAREKPALSVITKADTFDDIADAALFVHEMVQQNESYDTTQCEQIEKALSLLKTKAKELGLDEADLLAAIDSSDETSEACSTGTTSEQA